jgi:dipeptidyl aminopeptidase/acylaminoacyl peptidase
MRVLPTLFLLCASLAHAAGLPVLAPMDVFELEYAANPQIAPDGRSVIYERRAMDVMTDRVRSSLWRVALEDGAHRPLLADSGDYHSPLIAPDGARLAYVTSQDGRSRIHVRWLDSGATAVVAELGEAPSDLVWSPDGRWLAFTMEVPAEREPLVKPLSAPEGAAWAPAPEVVASVIYRIDGRGFLEPAYRQLFVVPAEGGSPRQLTDGPYRHDGPLSWTPDGTALLFPANRDPAWEYDPSAGDLWRVTVAGGALTRLTEHGGSTHPRVSPDGRQVAFLRFSPEPGAYRPSRLWLLDLETGATRGLSADLDRDVVDLAWTDEGRSLVLSYDHHGRRVLARTDLEGRRRILTDAVGNAFGRPYVGGEFTVSRDGVVAFTHATATRPADVAVVEDGEPRVLTALNEDLLAHRRLGELRALTWTSPVGDVEIQGWYLLPPDHREGDRHPLILELHGGPHLAYGPVFSAELQLLAAAGYVVFYDNYRGSSGYGEAFGQLLQYRYSSPDDFADHDSGIDALIEAGIADPERLFVTGGSAGGIATLYAIGLTDRFRAAAAAKPIANWLSKTLTGDFYTSQIRHQFPAPPWEAVEHYWSRSPLSLMGSVTTPTMLITGEEDYRTPISESEQYYQALRLKGVEAVMVRIPESGHGIASRPSRLIAKVRHQLAWFARHGGPPADPLPGSRADGRDQALVAQ